MQMVMEITKKPGNTGLSEHNKLLVGSNDTATIDEIQGFRKRLPDVIRNLNVPLLAKINVLEDVINTVTNRQMKLFAIGLQSAYIARLGKE